MKKILKEYSSSELVESCMKDYAIDVAISKLPHCIDGLKKIHRRILWCIKDEDPNSIIDIPELVGKIMKLHKVGDKSVMEAVIRSMQDFSMGMPLLLGKGNSGSYSSQVVGATRYLKCFISPLAKEVFFDKINIKTLSMHLSEEMTVLEPKYLIPRVPTSLLIANTTIGVGTKNEVYPLYLPNVCELMKKYVDNIKDCKPFYFGKHASLFIPDFPIKNHIRNIDELKKMYSEQVYDARVMLDGYMSITDNTVVIHTAPFGISMEKVKENIQKELSKKSSWLYDLFISFDDLVSNKYFGALTLTLKRNVNTFEVAKYLIKLLNIYTSVKPLYSYINEVDEVVHYTPDILFTKWYYERIGSIKSGIKCDQQDIALEILNKEIDIIIADNRDEIYNILTRKNTDIDKCLNELINRFNIPLGRATRIIDSKLKTIMDISKEQVLKDIKLLQEKFDDLHSKLQHPEEIIYRDAEYFQKKYNSPRKSKITAHLGYVKTNGNIVQFDNVDEAISLLSSFKNSSIFTYDRIKDSRYLYTDTKIRTNHEPSRIPEGDIIFEYFSKGNTLCITNDDNISIIPGIPNDIKDITAYSVKDNFKGILSSGEIIEYNTKDHLVEKMRLKRSTLKDDIKYIVPKEYNDFYLLYMNDTEDTLLRIAKVTNDTTNVMMTEIGTTSIIAVIPCSFNKEYFCTLPEWYKGTLKYIYINKVSKLEGKDVIKLTRGLTRHDKLSSMIEL